MTARPAGAAEDSKVDDPWLAWVGRTETRHDTITPVPAQAMAATLNHPDPAALTAGAPLPGLWIWLYFLPLAPMAQAGPDGHPRRGGFMPPIDLERRMWAASRCVFHQPVCIGDSVERTSEIAAISRKSGRSGDLAFVTVRHRVLAQGRLAIEEEQDIVYMAIPERFSPPPPTPVPPCDWSEAAAVDPVLLFRFSALTFNGHRIHYDRPYAADVERYPGLVVHGPLQAVLLFDAAQRWAHDRTPAAFRFKAVRPLFDFDAISINGRPTEDGGMDLFTAQGEGAVGMQAHMTWR